MLLDSGERVRDLMDDQRGDVRRGVRVREHERRASASSSSRAGSRRRCSCTGRRARRTRAARARSRCRRRDRSRCARRAAPVFLSLPSCSTPYDDAERRHHELARAEAADEPDVDAPVEAERLRDGLERAPDRRGDARARGVARVRRASGSSGASTARPTRCTIDGADLAQEAPARARPPSAATTRAWGTRYAGISSTSGRLRVPRRSIALPMTSDATNPATIPAQYKPTKTAAWKSAPRCRKNAAMSSAYVGMRAEHVISGRTRIVRRRCFGSRTMRVDGDRGDRARVRREERHERLAAEARESEHAIDEEGAAREVARRVDQLERDREDRRSAAGTRARCRRRRGRRRTRSDGPPVLAERRVDARREAREDRVERGRRGIGDEEHRREERRHDCDEDDRPDDRVKQHARRRARSRRSAAAPILAPVGPGVRFVARSARRRGSNSRGSARERPAAREVGDGGEDARAHVVIAGAHREHAARRARSRGPRRRCARPDFSSTSRWVTRRSVGHFAREELARETEPEHELRRVDDLRDHERARRVPAIRSMHARAWPSSESGSTSSPSEYTPGRSKKCARTAARQRGRRFEDVDGDAREVSDLRVAAGHGVVERRLAGVRTPEQRDGDRDGLGLARKLRGHGKLPFRPRSLGCLGGVVQRRQDFDGRRDAPIERELPAGARAHVERPTERGASQARRSPRPRTRRRRGGARATAESSGERHDARGRGEG